MKRFTIAFVVVSVASVAGIGAALASGTHYPTTLDAKGLGVGPPPSSVFIEFGRVHSAKRFCQSDRSLKMTAHYPDGSHKVLDTGRSSQNGAYALVGDFTGTDGVTITAARKRLGRPGHRRICNAGSTPVD
jgi:hypothetical protein